MFNCEVGESVPMPILSAVISPETSIPVEVVTILVLPLYFKLAAPSAINEAYSSPELFLRYKLVASINSEPVPESFIKLLLPS